MSLDSQIHREVKPAPFVITVFHLYSSTNLYIIILTIRHTSTPYNSIKCTGTTMKNYYLHPSIADFTDTIFPIAKAFETFIIEWNIKTDLFIVEVIVRTFDHCLVRNNVSDAFDQLQGRVNPRRHSSLSLPSFWTWFK